MKNKIIRRKVSMKRNGKSNTQKSYVCKIFGLIVAITVIAVSGGILLKKGR